MTNPLVEALKPCPFCGSDEVELVGGSVECNGCGTLGPDGSGLIPEHTSIEGWNKRISSFESQPSELCGEFTPSQLERLKRFFESQPSGWISVKDRLPPHMATVLAYINEIIIPGDGYFVDTVSYNEQRKSWQYALGNDDIDVAVTHWMPLPKAPENAG